MSETLAEMHTHTHIHTHTKRNQKYIFEAFVRKTIHSFIHHTHTHKSEVHILGLVRKTMYSLEERKTLETNVIIKEKLMMFRKLRLKIRLS
jgi:hypothetical protein